ncbi:leukotoxin LktA family filamentous adhesin [Thioalkalivibrio sulfidiphilus]|uniref:leukotoxin LktA family filamentous adhesin n=1 Tax=Thioalkalivibrio sulfidiphilus TaxID=1033854 RepID=UPI003BAE908E
MGRQQQKRRAIRGRRADRCGRETTPAGVFPRFRPHPLSLAALAAFGAAPGLLQADGSLGIVPDGRTQTHLDQSTPGITHIHTDTVRGHNAFNSFHHFQVGEGHTANLHLPQYTRNLINLVHDSRVVINGTLNSYKDGAIGGNVVFADPHGFVVGAGGQVNVGSLAVATPTTAFMNQLIAPDGGISDSHVARLLEGDIPVSADGLISIQGQVNATDAILLLGHQVQLSGGLNTRLSDTEHQVLFSSAVNVEGLGLGADVQIADGDIVIVARDDVSISGDISARGRSGRSGGTVLVTAGGHVTLESSARLDVSGEGAGSDGGTLVVYGESSATVLGAAELKARGGESGDGGFIEVSAGDQIRIQGGRYDAGASNGALGQILFDPYDIYVGVSDTDIVQSVDLFLTGNVTWIASESITIAENVTFSTRDLASGDHEAGVSAGDSGNIHFISPNILIEEGARLFAHVEEGSSYQAGSITLEALKGDQTRLGVATSAARIDVHGELRGGDINLIAHAAARVSEDATDTNALRGLATDLLDGLLDLVPQFDMGFGIADAVASIVVHDTAVLEASGDIHLDARATREVSLEAGAVGDLAGVAALYGELRGETRAEIRAGAQVSAGGQLAVQARSDNTLNLDAATRAGDNDVYFAGTLAIGIADGLETVASIALDAPADGDHAGDILVWARTDNDFRISALNEASPGGSVGLAAAVLDASTSSRAGAEGGIRVGGDLTVIAESDTAARQVAAATGAPDGGGGDGEGASAEGDSGAVAEFIQGFQGKQSEGIESGGDGPGGQDNGGLPLDLGAAVAVSLGGASSEARLGDTTLEAGGDVALIATTHERNLSTHALSGASSAAEDGSGNPLAVSAAVAVTDLSLGASAVIGPQASVNAARVGVLAQVDLPLRGAWGEDENTGSLDNLTGEQPEDLASYLTSHASASVEAGEDTQVGLGGAVNYLNIAVSTEAAIDGEVTASGAAGAWETTVDGRSFHWDQAVSVTARSRLETLDVAGNVTGFGSAVGIGGVFNWVTHDVNTRARIGAGAEIVTTGLAVNAEGIHTLIAYAPVSGSGDGGSLGLGAAGVYAGLKTRTTAEVQDNARVNVDRPVPGSPDPLPPTPDNVAVMALGRNTLEVASASIAAGQQTVGLSATVAYGDLDVETTARVGSGQGLNAADLVIHARNDNDLSVSAAASSEGTAALGIAAAIADVNTVTLAELSRDVTLDGGLTLAAESSTARLAVAAETSVADAEAADEGAATADNDQGSTRFVADRTQGASDQAAASGDDGQGGSSHASAPGTGDDGGLPIKFGSAVAINLASETADARIGNGVSVQADGDAVVFARRELHELETRAVSAATSSADGGDSGAGDSGVAVSISAGVAVGIIDQHARAIVGDRDDATGAVNADGVQISAARLGVGAELLVPARDEQAPGLDDFMGESDPDTGALNGHASATLSGSGDTVSLAGAVNYLDLSSAAEARIGSGAILTLAADGDPDGWSASLAGEELAAFAAVLDVAVLARVETITVAGNQAETGKVGIGGAFNWVQQDTRVLAEVLADQVSAGGVDADLRVAAERRDLMVVLTPVTGEAGETVGIGAGVALGMLHGETTARLEPGTELDITGAARVAAQGDNETVVAAGTSVSGSARVGFSATVAYTEVRGATRATARGGLSAGSLTVEAHNTHDHETSASAQVSGGAAVGIAAAVADIAPEALATLGGTVVAADGVTVLATSTSTGNQVAASTVASGGEEGEEGDGESSAGTSGNDQGSTDFARGRGEQGGESLDGRMAGSGDPGGNGGGDDSGGFGLQLGSALALNFSSQTARAVVEDGSSVTAADGEVAVIARTEDTGIRNWAEAGATSQTEDGDTSLLVSAAVAVGLYDYTAEALVGDNVTLSAARIGVAAEVSLPLGASLDKWTDLDGWIEFFETKPGLSAVDDNITEWAEAQIDTYASATTTSSGESIDIAGAVNYVDFSNTATAWVGEGSVLTATGIGTGPWSTVYGEDRSVAWTHGVTITAHAETATIDVAGNFDSLLSPGQSSDGGKLALGAAFNWVNHENKVTAGLADHVTVVAQDTDLGVRATAFDQVIAISPTSGAGAGIAGNGIVSLTLLDNETVASIGEGADITARSVSVEASQALSVWSVAGALTQADNAAVGIAVAANDLNTTTHAFIAGGVIRTDDLGVSAATSGLVGAGALAGALAGDAPGGVGEAKGLTDKASENLQDRTAETNGEADGLSGDDDAIFAEGEAELLAASEDGEDPNNPDYAEDGRLSESDRQGGAEDEFLADNTRAKSNTGSNDPDQKNFGIAVSGSGTVNLSSLETRAWVSGVQVEALDAGMVDVTISALNDTDLISVSGAGALVRAGKNADGPQVAFAGAVAYNVLANTTEAALRDSTLSDAGGVNVSAITSGDQIAIALGLAANTAASDSKSASLAGSVSIARTRNQTLSGIYNSSLDGTGSGDLAVLAYDRSRIASGGGALTLGGAIGVGAAVSVNLIGNGIDAVIEGGRVEGFEDVAVRALSASRILGLAAMVGFNKGRLGFGGSAVFNQVRNTIHAGIVEGAEVGAAGDVIVTAAGTDLEPAAVQALGRRDSGVDFDAGDTPLTNPDYQASEEDGSLDEAPQIGGAEIRGEAIIGIAGTITGSSKAAIGLSFAGNWVESSYTARIDQATVQAGGEVSVTAADSAVIIGVGVGGGASGKFAGMGAGVANVIRSSAEASVIGKPGFGGALDVDAGGLNVLALKESDIYSLAGGFAFSSKASIGAAVGYNEITTTTRARIEDARVRVDEAIHVDALSTSGIYGGAIAGAGAGTFALGGSVVINRIGQTVDAGVSGSTLTADSLRINAGDSDDTRTADIWALSGNIAGAGKVAVGVAVAYNEIGGWTGGSANAFTAGVDGSTLILSDQLEVRSGARSNVQTLAATGAFAGNVAAGASVAVSNIGTRVESAITDSRVNASGQPGAGSLDVTVSARDASTIRAAAGSLQGAGKVAVGLATAVNRIDTAVDARISGNLAGDEIRARNVVVDAYSESTIQTLTAGLSAAGKGGVAGSVSVNLLGGSVVAAIDNGARVHALNNVGVLAENRDVMNVVGGGLAFGLYVGAAGSVAVNLISSETHAYIDGAQVTALAAIDGDLLTVNDGSLANRPQVIAIDRTGEHQASADSYASGISFNALTENTRQVHGLAVNATSTQRVGVAAGSAGFAFNPKGSVGLAATVNVSEVGGETGAWIRNAQINPDTTGAGAGQTVDVKASSHTHNSSAVLGAAGALVAAGGAATVDVIDRSTRAYLEGGSVQAERVAVQARSTQGVTAIAAGFTVGGVGLAGSAPVVLASAETGAWIDGTEVRAVDLTVDAASDAAFSLIAGSASGGVLAGAAAIGFLQNDNLTRAYIQNSRMSVAGNTAGIDVTGDLVVQASAHTTVNTFVAGASYGSTGLAGMASVLLLDGTTEAWIFNSDVGLVSGGAGSVRVAASDSLSVDAMTGGVALGGNAAGAAAAVLLGGSRTEAAISRSDLQVRGDVDVIAERDWNIDLLTMSGALASGAGLGGAASVILLGQGSAGAPIIGELNQGGSGTLSSVDALTGAAVYEDDEALLTPEEQARLQGGSGARSAAQRVSSGRYNGVKALVDDQTRINAIGPGANLTVQATDRTRTLSTTGAVGLGLSMAGVGAGAGVTRIYTVVEAAVSDAQTIQGFDPLLVSASALDRGNGPAARIDALAGGGGAGLGLGAAYADARIQNTVSATLGGQGIEAGSILIQAEDSTSVRTDAKGAGGAFGIAVGVALSHAQKTSTVTAGVAAGAQIDNLPSLDIEATSRGQVSASATALAGGVFAAGAGADVYARDAATVNAGIGAGATVNLSPGGSLSVDARAEPGARAEALGVSVGGSAAVGVSLAEAVAATQVNAFLGSGASITGTGLDIAFRAISEPAGGGHGAWARATAGAGSALLAGAGADARARDQSQVNAYADANASILSPGSAPGAVRFEATARPRAYAEGTGISVSGALSIGVALADALVATQVNAWLGNGVRIEGDDTSLRLVATAVPGGSRAAEAQVTAGSGALVGATGARATARNSAQVRAYTGSDVRLPGGNVELRAVNTTDQLAQGRATTIGLLAGGVINASASSNTQTHAWLGQDNRAAGERVGHIDVHTFGENRDQADATSGTGGVVAGSAASVSTSSLANNSARILGGHGAPLRVGQVSVNATQQTRFSGTVDSTRASVAGASGARASHTVNSTVLTRVDDNADIRASNVILTANNVIRQVNRGENISVAAGGFLNGSAGRADATMIADTRVEMGRGAQVDASDGQGGGDIVVNVRNDIVAYQYAKLDTGGAVDIARVESHITSSNIGRVIFEEGARASAGGDLRVGVRTDADIEARGNSRTHGGAGFAQGRATAYLTTDHLIQVSGGATLESGGNLHLLTGYDASGGRGNLTAYAHVYVWNKTALPIQTDPYAHANLVSTNGIDLQANSVVIAGVDGNLRTSQGSYSARGEGRGKDLYREVAERVGNFFVGIANTFGANVPEVNLEIKKDSRFLSANDWIRVDGQLTVGTATYEYLIVTADESQPFGLRVETSRGVQVNVSIVDIRDELQAQLDQWQEIIDLFEEMSGQPGYADQDKSQLWIAVAQAQTLEAQLAALDSGETTVVQVDVANITARAGELYMETSTLTGGGHITLAPKPDNLPEFMQPEGAPSVLLLNRTDAFLRTNDITIESGTGRITLLTRNNVFGIPVPQVVDLTGQSVFGGIGITSPGLVGSQGEVVIVNDFDPPGGVSGIPPWIRLEGKISNPGGLVEVINRRGTIMTTGEIDAGTLNIRAGGDFVQLYRPGIDDIGGRQADGGRIVGGRIYINAQYININGLIQSGMPDWTVTFTQDHQDLMDAHLQGWLGESEITNPWYSWLSQWLSGSLLRELFGVVGGEAVGSRNVDPLLKLTGGEGREINWGELSAYYNAETDRIELTPEAVGGGYVFLFGHILSTGCENNDVGCGIQVRSGFGDISVYNETNREVVLRNLNVGDPVNGVVEIWDTGKADLQGNPWLTYLEHDYQSDVITRTEARLTLEFQEVGTNAAGQPITEAVVVPVNPDVVTIDGRETVYTPAQGLSILTYEGQRYVLPTWLAQLHQNVADIGRWFGIDFGIETQRADLPVEVKFIGNSAGRILVDSVSGVIIDGTLRNPEGTTTILTEGALSQINAGASLQGHTVIIDAVNGIGGEDNPVRLRVGEGGITAVTQTGDVYLSQSGGDLGVIRIGTGDGHVNVEAVNAIVNLRDDAQRAIYGGTLSLSAGGDVGRLDRGLAIDTGVGVAPVDGRVPLGASALNVTSGGDVHVIEVDGDLQVEQLLAVGTLRVRVDNGDLINAFERGELDEEAINRLRSIWQEMRLTREWGVGDAIEESVRAYETLVQARYAEYWLLRELSDGSGVFDLDEAGQDLLRHAALRDLLPALMPDNDTDLDEAHLNTLAGGLDAAQINAYAASRYGELESEFRDIFGVDDLTQVSGFDSFRDDFSYTAPEAVREAIAEGAEWTEEELLRGIDAGALIEVTDTQFERLAPNLIGERIEISTPNGRVGAADDPLTILFPGDTGAPFEFTPEQIAALVSAQPGDIRVLGDAVFNEFGELVSGTVEGLVIERARPVGVVHGVDGSITAEASGDAGGDIFLGATEAIMILERIAGGGNVRLQTRAGLFSAQPGVTVIEGAGGGLLLEGGTGPIGTVDAPIQMSLSAAPYVTARATGDIHLHEIDGSLTVERMFSQDGSVNLQAAGDILSFYNDALVDIRAGGATLIAGGRIGGQGDEALDLDLGEDGTVAASAGDEIHLAAPEGDLRLAGVHAGGDVSLIARDGIFSAYGDVAVPVLDLSGPRDGWATLIAGTGIGLESAPIVLDIGGVDAYTAAGGIHLYALDDLAAGEIHAPAGPVDISVDGDFSFDSLIAGDWIRLRSFGDLVGESLLAVNGIEAAAGFDRFGEAVRPAWIRFSELEGLWARLRATAAIELGLASVYEHLHLRADYVDAGVAHLMTEGPMLEMRLEGANQEAAEYARLVVDAPLGLHFPVYAAMDSELRTTASEVRLDQAYVSGMLELFTPGAYVYMNNRSPAPVRSSVQLYETDHRFFLEQNAVETYTSAYVVWYAPGFQVRVPNYLPGRQNTGLDYEGASVVRDTERFASHGHGNGDLLPAMRSGVPGDADDEDLVESLEDLPLNLGASHGGGVARAGN